MSMRPLPRRGGGSLACDKREQCAAFVGSLQAQPGAGLCQVERRSVEGEQVIDPEVEPLVHGRTGCGTLDGARRRIR